jgi:hypothetical protein
MLKNKQLQEDLITLVEAKKWDVIKDFFRVWDDEDEMIDKVLLWGHFFLNHYFRDSSPEFHREIIRRFFSKQNEYTAAPRGFSKTTLLQACCDFSIANKLDKFIVIVEKTASEASEVIKGMHDEFLDNEKINLAYGEMVGKQSSYQIDKLSGVKQREARGDVFINGIRIRGKGFNSTVRGLKTREWRPSRIILDDVEEDEHINSPEQRQKYQDNYNKGVIPAIDIDGTIKVFGTILHQDSLLKNLIDSHKGKIFRAYDKAHPKNTLLWPARWPMELLEKKRKEMQLAGKSNNAFSQEYLNDPVSEEERKFKYDWLWEMIASPDDKENLYKVPKRRVTMKQLEKMRHNKVFVGFAQIDTADSTTAGADFTGAIVQLVDSNNNRYRVDVRREKRNINGVIDLIFEIWEKWKGYGLIKIGIEKKAYADQILPLFKEACRERQAYPVIEELKPMGRKKENRIEGGLQGFYENGKIISVGNLDKHGFFKSVGETEDLLNELYEHPAAKNDDLADAEAYGADIIIVPMEDEKKPVPHHTPQDDPFEDDLNPIQNNQPDFGRFDDPDPFD